MAFPQLGIQTFIYGGLEIGGNQPTAVRMRILDPNLLQNLFYFGIFRSNYTLLECINIVV